MDLAHLAARVCVTHRPSISKAKEYQRLAAIKLQGQPKAASPEAQSVCCIELGCKFYDASFDPALCLKYSLCKTPQAYAKVLASLQHDLGLHTVVSTKELCLQHGCPQANDLAKRVLHTYKEAMSAGNPASAAAAASSSSAAAAAASPSAAPIAVALPSIPVALLSTRSVYPCVAFYLSCKLLKIASVDKKRLLQTAQCTEKEFMNVADSFRSVMPELKPKEPASAGSSPDKRKRKKKSDDDGAATDAAANSDGLIPIDDDPDFGEPGLDLGGELLGAVAADSDALRRLTGDAEPQEERKEQTAKKQRTDTIESAEGGIAPTSRSAVTDPASASASAPTAAAAAASSPSPRKKSSRSGPVVFSSPAPFFVPTVTAPNSTLAAPSSARSSRAKKLELS